MSKNPGKLSRRLQSLRSELQTNKLRAALRRVEDACTTFSTTSSDRIHQAVIEQPPCPNCNAMMRFGSVSIVDNDHDLRTFVCDSCRRAQDVIVRLIPRSHPSRLRETRK